MVFWVNARGPEIALRKRGSGWLRPALNALAFVGLICWACSVRAEPRAGVHWAGTPAWVSELAPDITTPVDPAFARDGRYTLLNDVRYRLGKSSIQRYFRHVDMAVSQAGVAALGEVEIEYSPEYQHLSLHRAALLRNGQVIDETGHASLRLLEQEPDSAHRVYSGSVSALLVLSDVRPGDIVDVAYSLDGANPVLHDRFAGYVRLGGRAQTRRMHVQVESANGRPMLHWSVRGTAPPPSEVQVDGKRVLTWDLSEVRPAPDEDRTPASFTLPAELALSDFADWSEVARWASKLYPPAPSPTITAKAAEFSASSADLDGAVLRAVRFVQDDVRYLSISLGQHSVTPHVPQGILDQRFGDCKDKSYLLVEMLRALGVEAHPALADSYLRGHLRESLPSPFAFDHVITVIELHGKRHFVDATWSYQGGTLDQLAPLDLGAVLLVSPDTKTLVELPSQEAAQPLLSTEADYTVNADGTATLQVTTTYRREEADGMRARLAAKSATDFSRGYLNFYEKAFPGIAILNALRIEDARESDIVKRVESYSIPEFWRAGERGVIPDMMWDYLEAPKSQRRETPLSLSYPIWIRETQRITLPFTDEREASQDVFDDPAARVTRSVQGSGHVVTAVHEYRSLADTVPLDGVPHHLQFLSDARKQVGVDLQNQSSPADSASAEQDTTPDATRARSSTNAYWWPLVAVCGIIAVCVGLFWRFARIGARKMESRNQRAGAEGELPQSAKWVLSLEEARKVFVRVPCACGADFAEASIEFSTLAFQGRTLLAGRAGCSHCQRQRRSYFALPELDSGIKQAPG